MEARPGRPLSLGVRALAGLITPRPWDTPALRFRGCSGFSRDLRVYLSSPPGDVISKNLGEVVMAFTQRSLRRKLPEGLRSIGVTPLRPVSPPALGVGAEVPRLTGAHAPSWPRHVVSHAPPHTGAVDAKPSQTKPPGPLAQRERPTSMVQLWTQTGPVFLKAASSSMDPRNPERRPAAPLCSPPSPLLHLQPFGLKLDVENLGQAPPELLQDHLLGQALRAAPLLRLLALSQQTGARGFHHLPGDARGPPAETHSQGHGQRPGCS